MDIPSGIENYRAIFYKDKGLTTLHSLAKKYGTDKISVHNYIDLYENYFHKIKGYRLKILEIGIKEGASLRMWKDYFINSDIYGIDIDKKDVHGCITFKGDQENENDLQRFIDLYGGNFDIIIDDGGHTTSQQRASYNFLSKHINKGGYYIIEDLHAPQSNLLSEIKDKGHVYFDKIIFIKK